MLAQLVIARWYKLPIDFLMYTLLCVNNTVMSNVRVKLAKNQAAAKQHLEAKLLLIGNYSFSSSTLSSKNNRKYLEKCTKSQLVCLTEVTYDN